MRVSLLLLWSMGFYAVTGAAGQTPVSPALQSATAFIAAGNAERGRYLVESVATCDQCHSSRNSQGAVVPTTRYQGGPTPPQPSWAGAWALRAPRIAGLVGYSDYEAMRLLTAGSLGRNGRPLQAPMPRFRMTPQDAADVIVYLRSLP